MQRAIGGGGAGPPPPKPNQSACISTGLILTYSSLTTPNFPRLPYIPTHCTSGPSLVSILRSACSSCGLRSASSCALSFESAKSRRHATS